MDDLDLIRELGRELDPADTEPAPAVRAAVAAHVRRPVGRRIARRPRRLLAGVAALGCAAAIAVLAVAGLLGDLVGGQPALARHALAIERNGEWMELRIADAAAGANEMNGDLRAVGIDAEVIVIPVARARVGQWVAVAEQPTADGGRIGRFSLAGRIEGFPGDVLRVHRDLGSRPNDGHFVLYAGRAARKGERVVFGARGERPLRRLPGMPGPCEGMSDRCDPEGR
jgi:hypothetical protein